MTYALERFWCLSRAHSMLSRHPEEEGMSQ